MRGLICFQLKLMLLQCLPKLVVQILYSSLWLSEQEIFNERSKIFTSWNERIYQPVVTARDIFFLNCGTFKVWECCQASLKAI